MSPLDQLMALLQAPKPYQPVQVRPDYGLSTITGIDRQRSQFEPTLGPGEKRSADELQSMLADVILAAGSGVVPGAGPKGQARLAPARVRRGSEAQFAKWFGDSVVKEPSGAPLTVYKGMDPHDWTKEPARKWNEPRGEKGPVLNVIQRPGEFPAFNKDEPGVKVAGFFGGKDVANKFSGLAGESGAVYPAHLKMERPFVIDAKGGKSGDVQFGASGAAFREAIRSGKYDGVIIRNTADEGDVYVPLHPTQIKSAMGNRGTYDPKNPDIRE